MSQTIDENVALQKNCHQISSFSITLTRERVSRVIIKIIIIKIHIYIYEYPKTVYLTFRMHEA